MALPSLYRQYKDADPETVDEARAVDSQSSWLGNYLHEHQRPERGELATILSFNENSMQAIQAADSDGPLKTFDSNRWRLMTENTVQAMIRKEDGGEEVATRIFKEHGLDDIISTRFENDNCKIIRFDFANATDEQYNKFLLLATGAIAMDVPKAIDLGLGNVRKMQQVIEVSGGDKSNILNGIIEKLETIKSQHVGNKIQIS